MNRAEAAYYARLANELPTLIAALREIIEKCSSNHAAIRTPGDTAADIARAALAKIKA